MAISEVNMRKNELEDITNTNKAYHKKMTFKKNHTKSVSFENCLLTPKDEDYYYDDHVHYVTHEKENDLGMPSPHHIEDDTNESICGESMVTEESIDSINDTSVSSTTSVENSSQKQGNDLSKNPDYIVLTSSLRLLKSNKNHISNEIVELSQLLECFERCNDEKEIIKFFHKLITNKVNLPKQNKILKCPIVKISKYQTNLNTTNDKPLFKTLNLFNN